MSRRRINLRLLSATGFFVIVLLLLFGRAFELQVVNGEEYRTRAASQHVRTVEIAPRRGVIYDRNGAELAVSKRMATVYATPYLVEDAADAAAKLAPVLGLSVEEVKSSLSRRSGFSYVARKVDVEVGKQVAELGIRGVGVFPEEKRVYPRGALAPQVLGYVGTDNVGLAGVEQYYDSVLAGEGGRRDEVRDPFGKSLEVLLNQEGVEGGSLVLTLDEDMQNAVEQVLVDLVEEFEAKRASALVLQPKSGEVLAMANVPLFDTNDFGEADAETRRNATVTDQFEPGSTFKTIIVAAALEEALVTPDTTLEVGPSIDVADRTIHEAHDVPAVRNLTVTEILAESSNVGAVMLGQSVGKERLIEMIRRFGFVAPLGIDYPGEAAGMMLKEDEWSGSTIGNVPIGHGVSVTALQLATAYATIANGGVQIPPHLVRQEQPPEGRRVIATEVADQLRRMLEVAVTDGTGAAARVEGYVVAGKTGTAQKVSEDSRGYVEGSYVSSFVGMVPAEDPELVILVVVDDPTTEYYGSVVAAPAFSKIADFALKHLEIAPFSASETDRG